MLRITVAGCLMLLAPLAARAQFKGGIDDGTHVGQASNRPFGRNIFLGGDDDGWAMARKGEPTTPLPVTLTEFGGRWQQRAALLFWKTATETNALHFELERSFDSRTFAKIQRIAAAGHSSSPRSYEYPDANVAQLLPAGSAYVYYRLRTVDNDGTALSIGVDQKAGSFDVKVFALEMVYIPQGPFWAGYNNVVGADNYGDGSSLAPLQITSAFPPTMGNGAGQLWDPRGTGTINSSFPTGYNAYYMMKYELSQAGYRDFLNSISYNNSDFLPERSDLTTANHATAGTKLFLTGVRNNLEVRSSSMTTGYVGADANNNGTYNEAADGEWTACGSLLWSDAAAFLDWACLRPMTELEYEKAANGPEPQPYPRFATGTYIIPPTGGLANANTSAEKQVRTSLSTNYINTSDGTIDAPLRSGYAADATSDRKLSGGSYYGVMDLSGNLWEPCVTTANAAGRSFKGNVGDGILSVTEGRANQNSWPGVKNTENTANAAGEVLKDYTVGIGMKGGSFVEDYTAAITSALQDPNYPTTRANAKGYGCRGVRQP
ncbi:SUMF1/EgtB/PvdO family nonheme iron enzyme [Hymenobacter ruricola]|uniref:SUMF1/EgtB/PvdO family nonheme iron enzyme n=1 Tax=Hymenobacter ruricola TaxID=2791023 RepID=A0ABS0I636_9BACT|nr:SUMF1/EgtB/PvdO family nonheme iron enzyme [Hymenobacter ruricola]MBF9222216.1 SUMF1/EgtB/PvdO family nonheme iron enzyme [Hymenobacter ruricola]